MKTNNPVELKTSGKVGVWINLGFNVISIFYLIYLFIIYKNIAYKSTVIIELLGTIRLSRGIFVFLFVLAPVLIIFSLYFNIRLLYRHFDYQSRAILFGILSGSIMGSLFLMVGKVDIPAYELSDELKKQLDQLKKPSSHKIMTQPMYQQPTYQPPYHETMSILLKYKRLLDAGLITQEEYETLIQRLRDARNNYS